MRDLKSTNGSWINGQPQQMPPELAAAIAAHRQAATSLSAGGQPTPAAAGASGAISASGSTSTFKQMLDSLLE